MAVNLDIDLLRSLLAIAEEGGFSAAAERVFRTQSAISQQMRRLEDITGQTIFIKKGRSRVLTPAGQNLFRYAQSIVALNDQAVTMVQASEQGGAVRVGAPLDIADSILPKVLKQFAQSHPRVRVILRVDRSPNLMRQLADSDLDITWTTRRSERFDGKLIRTSPTVWICSESFQLTRSEPVPLILADEPSIFRRTALSVLDQHGVPHIERYTCPTLSSIRVALTAGLGVTARTPELLQADLRVLGQREGLPPMPDVNFYVYKANAPLDPPARHMFEQICDA